ncbi:MAG: methyltransferase [Cyclobacteriaceae bacterium]|nr:methyltransferase [Cyclobacteriaceae bacterium]
MARNQPLEPFRFQQFAVGHDRCSMKVGTDAVLLGCWASTAGCLRVLDIGTGSGVIALMIAQRTGGNVFIDAIDIQLQDLRQAAENFAASPWSGRMNAIHSSLQEFSPSHRYDLIVSNPPFFNKSLRAPDAGRTVARHSDDLPHDSLLSWAREHLSDTGRLAIVIPPLEGGRWKESATGAGLHLCRQCEIRSGIGRPVERWLLEWSMQSTAPAYSSLHLYDNGQFSKEYASWTSEFYLPKVQ